MIAAAPLQPTVNLYGSAYGVGVTNHRLNSILVLNFAANWTLGGLGTTDLANIERAKWEARQAAIRAKQTFQAVFSQVRTSYDEGLAADARIDHANSQIRAAEEELRISAKRMQAGVGLNLDVLNAQRDLTQARINKARAIIDFDIAQANLLHDTGLISMEALSHGAAL
jgi:outer membrane protein TolC